MFRICVIHNSTYLVVDTIFLVAALKLQTGSPEAYGQSTATATMSDARSSFWRVMADWAMLTKQARRLLAIAPDAARSGFLPRRSYVAPSPQRRSPASGPK